VPDQVYDNVQFDLSVSGSQLLTAIWDVLMRTNAKLQQLAANPIFVAALLANPTFCAGVSRITTGASLAAVAQAMGS